ncbi:hypothetical protein VP01_227g8 [Puccinia sorghi]|uniref:DDE Tnp4 domain-containing protein n=1 Tax=Puccinia sorghi TaxID=27349 RepID=A0A0L6V822_9BASI|nr:hypothetical protein VP01_227g8 [Puccinia sorghi]
MPSSDTMGRRTNSSQTVSPALPDDTCGFPVVSKHLTRGIGARPATPSLYRLVHGCTYVTIGHVFNIVTKTADQASGRFVLSVLKILQLRSVSIKESFEEKHGIPGIAIVIVIAFQCVVDGDGNFRDVGPWFHSLFLPRCDRLPPVFTSRQICGGAPGSVHDSRVFRKSEIGHSLIPHSQNHQIIPPGSYWIGDAGYPADVGVLIPYPLVATPENEHFNFIHSSTRMVVKQAFGRLKNRFRILLTAQRANVIRARNNMFATMVLHNILNRRGTLYIQEWDKRTPGEATYDEVLGTNLPQNHDESSTEDGRQTMSAIRDQIRLDQCS